MSAITTICKHGNVTSKIVCGFCENTSLADENRSLRDLSLKLLNEVEVYAEHLGYGNLHYREIYDVKLANLKTIIDDAQQALKISSGEK